MPRKKQQDRNPRGEGSVFRRKDGRWVAEWWCEELEKTLTRYTKTEAAAWEKLAELKRGVGLVRAEVMTVTEYLAEYAQARENNTPPNTLRNIRNAIRLHIIPAIGHLRITCVTQRHIQVMVNEWSKAKRLAPSTVDLYYSITHGAFTHATRIEIIEKNPCHDVVLPKIPRPKREAMSPEEIIRLLQAIPETHWFWTFLIVALGTGMRKGELLSLCWSDVDLLKKVLHIRHNVSRIKGGFVEGAPKSESGRRSIPLMDEVVDALHAHRLRQVEQQLAAEAWVERDLVFSHTNGDYLHQNYPNRELNAALDRAGLTLHRKPHDCRHGFASQLLGNRVNPKAVSELLGHAGIEITLSIYGHCLPGEHEGAIGTLQQALWGNGGASKVV